MRTRAAVAIAAGKPLEVMDVETPAAKAIQPFAISKATRYKNLSQRLYKAIAESRDQFETAGFHFRLYDAEQTPAE